MFKFTFFQNLLFGLTLLNSLVLIFLFDETSIDTHLFSISIPIYIAAVLSTIISYVVVPKLATCKDDIFKMRIVFSSIFILFLGMAVVLLGSQFVIFKYIFSTNSLYLGNIEIVNKIRMNCTIAAFFMICNSIQISYLYYKEHYLTANIINIFAVILQLAIIFLFSSSIIIVSFSLMLTQCLVCFLFFCYTWSYFSITLNGHIFKDLLSSSSSLFVSAVPSRFDIVQDRTLLSNTGGILYLHYARLACDTIATSMTKAFSIIQLTQLSKNSKERFDNISYLILIVAASSFYFLIYFVADYIDKTNIYALRRYLEIYKLLYIFLISAVSSTFLINYFYSKHKFWPVSLASASLSIVFIGLKQYYFSDEIIFIIPIFLSLRGFLNSIFLFVLLTTLKIKRFNDIYYSFFAYFIIILFGLIIL